MNGITGSALADTVKVGDAVKRIKSHTDLPICVGFGVKSAEQAKAIGQDADGVVVGSAIVSTIADSLDENGHATAQTNTNVAKLIEDLAAGVASAR
jgi:tryptophan synthase alpha chain